RSDCAVGRRDPRHDDARPPSRACVASAGAGVASSVDGGVAGSVRRADGPGDPSRSGGRRTELRKTNGTQFTGRATAGRIGDITLSDPVSWPGSPEGGELGDGKFAWATHRPNSVEDICQIVREQAEAGQA